MAQRAFIHCVVGSTLARSVEEEEGCGRGTNVQSNHEGEPTFIGPVTKANPRSSVQSRRRTHILQSSHEVLLLT